MLETVIAFSRYFIALLFGSAIAARFIGITKSRKNTISFVIFLVSVFFIQLTCLLLFGMDMTLKLYPLICHLPIAMYIALYPKRPWLRAFISMFVSFLCCQPPRWIGAVLGSIFHHVSMDHIGYILGTLCMYILLNKYAFHSVQHLMERSTKSCILFGIMPVFYYLFDYITTVYTDIMYQGTRAAVQFLPFVTAAFYFVFVLIYYEELKKQALLEREREILHTQFRLAQTEFNTLKQIQQNAATYRHDMRHHFSLLLGMANEERIHDMKEYLSTAQKDMDGITPLRLCKNETINLILSAYMNKAKESAIEMTSDIKLPDSLPFSDTELCSLLSNALENAISGSKSITTEEERKIRLKAYSKNNKLCIDIRNTYSVEPIFHQYLPITKAEGHGYGTKSMAHIIEKHGGVYQFLVKDGWFIFQATT